MSDDPDKIEPSIEDVMGGEPVEKPARKSKAKDEVRLHPILSNEDVHAAQAKALKRVEDERRTAAMKAVEDAETERLRVEEGLTTGVREMDEMVNVTIDLAPYAPNIVINHGTGGNIYWNGRTYLVPRHLADSLAEIMSRSWKHEDQVDGKSITQAYARKRETVINARTGAVANAPARFDA